MCAVRDSTFTKFEDRAKFEKDIDARMENEIKGSFLCFPELGNFWRFKDCSPQVSSSLAQ